MRRFLSRLAGLARLRYRDDRLDDEVRFHVEMLTERHVRRGLSREAARAAALREFGGVIQMKETYRDARSFPSLENLLQDAQYGVRTLLRTPAFTLAAVLTLALGIGATTAIFSVVNAVLLRPLPYPEPERLVQFLRKNQAGEWTAHTGLRFMFFRDHMRSFEAMAAWRGAVGYNLVAGDAAEYVNATPVSKEFFDVFGVRPAYGGVFTADHDRVDGPDVTILGHALWRRYFGGDSAVVGRTVLLGDRPHTIVGVMPQGFRTLPAADLYVPLRTGTTGPGSGFNYIVVARLMPGLTREQAMAEGASVFEAFKDEYGDRVGQTEVAPLFTPFQQSLTSEVRRPLLFMLAAVGLLLLIACANTANLLLARASARGREIAVRAALGAGRGRIAAQLLTESVVLALVGGAAGLALAYWAVPALLALTPPGYLVEQEIRVDRTVLSASLLLSLATGLLFGLAPALAATRGDLSEAFKEDGTRTTGARSAGRLRHALVIGEVALCLVLLVGAGLLIQTFIKLRGIDPGFDTSNVLTARMSLQGDRYADREALVRFYDRALERIRVIPGVRSAAVVNGVPIEFGLNLNVTVLDGPERVEQALTDWRYATTNYFDTMGIPIVAGRGFTERDTASSPAVAVVSEEFARTLLPGVNPIGHHIRVFDDDPAIEIVGVAKSVREQGLTGPLPAVMYTPVTQAHVQGLAISHSYFPVSWVIRAERIGPGLIRRMQEEVRAIDPALPFSTFRTMDEVKGAQLSHQRFQMTLLSVFAGIGLLLGAAGIYGLIAYSVTQRTRELGIRMALGASRGRVLASVIRQGALLAAIGIAVGVLAGVLLARTLESWLYEVSPLDPTTFAAVAMALMVVAVTASLVPAIRAVRLDPVAALRD